MPRKKTMEKTNRKKGYPGRDETAKEVQESDRNETMIDVTASSSGKRGKKRRLIQKLIVLVKVARNRKF